jgi:hypothetical protein
VKKTTKMGLGLALKASRMKFFYRRLDNGIKQAAQN